MIRSLRIVPVLQAVFITLAIYGVSLLFLLETFFEMKGSLREGGSDGWRVAFWLALGLHFVLALICGALLARWRAAPPLPVAVISAAAIFGFWLLAG